MPGSPPQASCHGPGTWSCMGPGRLLGMCSSPHITPHCPPASRCHVPRVTHLRFRPPAEMDELSPNLWERELDGLNVDHMSACLQSVLVSGVGMSRFLRTTGGLPPWVGGSSRQGLWICLRPQNLPRTCQSHPASFGVTLLTLELICVYHSVPLGYS